MAKRFIAKTKKKKLLLWAVYGIGLFLVYNIAFGIFTNIKLTTSNEAFLRSMLEDSNHHMVYQKNANRFFNQMTTFLANFNIKDPLSMLEKGFSYHDSKIESTFTEEDFSEPDRKDNSLDLVTNHIKDPNPTNVKNPYLYIYNSHQLENYNMTNLELYNITPNVMMTSYLLREKLNKLGIPTIVEEADFTRELEKRNWSYQDGYKLSRLYLDAVKKSYPTVQFFLDIHRDIIKKEESTTTIQNKKYARVLFVVGMDHKNYEKNLKAANAVNDAIKKAHPTLTRGVITKSGEGVNGVYNQDFSSQLFLLEVGGQDNTIDEIANTIDLLAPILKSYVEANYAKG